MHVTYFPKCASSNTVSFLAPFVVRLEYLTVEKPPPSKAYVNANYLWY